MTNPLATKVQEIEDLLIDRMIDGAVKALKEAGQHMSTKDRERLGELLQGRLTLIVDFR